MLKRVLAFTCLTLSIGANSATVTYTSTEANIAPGAAGMVGTVIFDTVAGQITGGTGLQFAGESVYAGGNILGFDWEGPNETGYYSVILPGDILLWRMGGSFTDCFQLEADSCSYYGAEYLFGDYVNVVEGTFQRVVPLPAAAWLFGSALLGLGVVKRKKA